MMSVRNIYNAVRIISFADYRNVPAVLNKIKAEVTPTQYAQVIYETSYRKSTFKKLNSCLEHAVMTGSLQLVFV